MAKRQKRQRKVAFAEEVDIEDKKRKERDDEPDDSQKEERSNLAFNPITRIIHKLLEVIMVL